MNHTSIIQDIITGKFSPIYLLHGEEPYFIDEITNEIIKHALEDHERDFNQLIIYGKEADPVSLTSELRNYPMMATRKLVILKEAQDFKGMDELEGYFENPCETTIFIVNYKYKNYDSRKRIMKLASQKGLVFKSEKIKEYNLAEWITKYVKSIHLNITPKACMLLAEFLGNDLGKIVNELEKLQLLVEKGTIINDVHIEENIGISKDYNAFELTNAVSIRDFYKSIKIIDYFANNPKATDISLVIGNMFKLFSQLMRIHFLSNKTKEAVANALKLHPYVAGELLIASRNFSPQKIAVNIAILHEFDLKSKGIGSTGNFSQGDLMKELIYRLLN